MAPFSRKSFLAMKEKNEHAEYLSSFFLVIFVSHLQCVSS